MFCEIAPEEILQWTKKDGELHNYIGAVIPEALAHTGATAFDEHLKGVQSVLRNWRADENLATAGLFHSIYGTEGFQGFKLPFTKRQQIRQLIGKKAERLVWIFCVVDRLTVDNLVDRYHEWLLQPAHGVAMVYQFTSRIELGRFPIVFQDESEWLDYIELTLADWLEQVEGAAEKANDLYGWGIGEAFSYRRHAYHKMAEILSTRRAPRLLVAKEMLQEVSSRFFASFRSFSVLNTPLFDKLGLQYRI